MQILSPRLILWSGLLIPALLPAANNPFIGRWDFNINTPGGLRASWLGITDKGQGPEIWYQPTGGNVYQVKDFKINGSHLTLNLVAAKGSRPAMTWDLDADGDQLQAPKSGARRQVDLTGVRAPELKRKTPKAWTTPEPLFNGKNLDGWEPIGDPANSHWTVKDGLLGQRGARRQSEAPRATSRISKCTSK